MLVKITIQKSPMAIPIPRPTSGALLPSKRAVARALAKLMIAFPYTVKRREPEKNKFSIDLDKEGTHELCRVSKNLRERFLSLNTV